MSRLRRRVRAEENDVRIRMYLAFGGFYYRTIAKRVFGRNWSESDVSHVGKVAREWNMSSREWRKGQSDDAKRYLTSVERSQQVKKAVKATAMEGKASPFKLAVAG